LYDASRRYPPLLRNGGEDCLPRRSVAKAGGEGAVSRPIVFARLENFHPTLSLGKEEAMGTRS